MEAGSLSTKQKVAGHVETKWESFQFSFIPSRIEKYIEKWGGRRGRNEGTKVSIYLSIARKDDKKGKGLERAVCFFTIRCWRATLSLPVLKKAHTK